MFATCLVISRLLLFDIKSDLERSYGTRVFRGPRGFPGVLLELSLSTKKRNLRENRGGPRQRGNGSKAAYWRPSVRTTRGGLSDADLATLQHAQGPQRQSENHCFVNAFDHHATYHRLECH